MLVILFIVTLIIALRPTVRRVSFLHSPTLTALAYLFFLLPQMTAFEVLDLSSKNSNQDAYLWIVVYAIACLLASLWGWHSGVIVSLGNWIFRTEKKVNQKILSYLMLFVATFANLAAFQLDRMESSSAIERINGQMTGTGTKVVFIARLVYIPYAYLLGNLLQKTSLLNIFLFVSNAYLTVQRIILRGRRSPISLLALPVLGMLYFKRGYVVPKSFVVASVVFPMIAIPALAALRYDFWQMLFTGQINFSFIQNLLSDYFLENYPYDFENAVNIVRVASERLYFGFGSGYWNDLVFNFVPAQFLGADFKDALYIKLSPFSYLNNRDLSIYFPVKLGTTQTGLGSSFTEFGFLGFFCFFFQAKFMRTIWVSATAGGTISQIAYCFFMTSVFLSVTHGFEYFINYVIIFVGIVMLALILSSLFRKKSVIHLP